MRPYKDTFYLLEDSLEEHQNAQLIMSIDKLHSFIESRKTALATASDLNIDGFMSQISAHVQKLIDKTTKPVIIRRF